MISKNTICLWYDGDAVEAARFYAETFPNSAVGAVFRAPGDYPDGKQGDVLTVEFTVAGIPCIGLNGGPQFKHSEAFSFQIATDDQAETDRLWNAIVGNGGQESECGWCKDRWGLSWQITPRALIDGDHRSRPRGGQARVRRDDDHGEDRHRQDRGGAAGLTRWPPATTRTRGACSMSHLACILAAHPSSGPMRLYRRRMSRFPESTFHDRDEGPSFLSRVVLSLVLLTAGTAFALLIAAA